MTMFSVWDFATKNEKGYWDLAPNEILTSKEVVLIDVRDVSEFTGQLGHIRGAQNVPLLSLHEVSRNWSMEDIYVLVCRSGRRSASAAEQLSKRGFPKVINLLGEC